MAKANPQTQTIKNPRPLKPKVPGSKLSMALLRLNNSELSVKIWQDKKKDRRQYNQ